MSEPRSSHRQWSNFVSPFQTVDTGATSEGWKKNMNVSCLHHQIHPHHTNTHLKVVQYFFVLFQNFSRFLVVFVFRVVPFSFWFQGTKMKTPWRSYRLWAVAAITFGSAESLLNAVIECPCRQVPFVFYQSKESFGVVCTRVRGGSIIVDGGGRLDLSLCGRHGGNFD
jgi:hypothetical protein